MSAASSSNNTDAVDPTNVWIYHERQEALLCGQHALHNLAQQAHVFPAHRLASIAQRLDAMELDVFAASNNNNRQSADYLARLREGSHHVDAAGNFSIEVLKAAVQDVWGVPLVHVSQRVGDICTIPGLICHKSDHWFAIRLVGGRYWNLNSLLDRPVPISHFTLATRMAEWEKDGYTVFCVQGVSSWDTSGRRPPSTVTDSPKAQWHTMADLLKGKSTEADPWEKLNGAGMRLDGRSSKKTKSNSNSSGQHHQQPNSQVIVEGLSEDEMLQLALQASLEQPPPQASGMTATTTASTASSLSLEVPPEPAANTPGAIRIQFKLPDQSSKRLVRRFAATDTVAEVVAYCRSVVVNGAGVLDLRYGYPPRDLMDVLEQTVEEAKLANESVQGRYR